MKPSIIKNHVSISKQNYFNNNIYYYNKNNYYDPNMEKIP